MKAASHNLSKAGGCLWKGLLICIGICLAPFVIMAVLAILGALGMLLCSLGGVVVALGACILGGLAVLVATCVYVGVLPISAIICLFLAAIGIIAGSVLGICLMLVAIRWLWRGLVWCCRRMYYWIARKPMPQDSGKFAPPPVGAYSPSDPEAARQQPERAEALPQEPAEVQAEAEEQGEEDQWAEEIKQEEQPELCDGSLADSGQAGGDCPELDIPGEEDKEEDHHA